MLDENQQLILAVMENQSLGKMQECVWDCGWIAPQQMDEPHT
jgi:hypothetical protein